TKRVPDDGTMTRQLLVLCIVAGCGDNLLIPSADGIAITPGDAQLQINDTVEVSAVYTIGDATEAAADVEWSASPSGVVSIDPHGARATLTALAGGSATVTAMGRGFMGTATV